MKLTREAYQKAVDFIKTQADPIEQALFAYEFEGGSSGEVLNILEGFQNEDGGYCGLEHDALSTGSTALDTSWAFQKFRWLGVGADHPQVRAGVNYWLNTLNPDGHIWPIKPDASPDTVGAPWWKAKDLKELLERFGGCKANPKAEVVGYLHDYASLVHDDDLVKRLTQETVDRLFALPDDMDQNELHCYVRLTETESLDEDVRSQILRKLLVAFPASVSEPDRWHKYSLRPLWVIDHPDSPLLACIDVDMIEQNIAFKIERQGEDGSWTPFWDWGGHHAEQWQVSKRAWAGIITLRTLMVLRNFDRIESASFTT